MFLCGAASAADTNLTYNVTGTGNETWTDYPDEEFNWNIAGTGTETYYIPRPEEQNPTDYGYSLSGKSWKKNGVTITQSGVTDFHVVNGNPYWKFNNIYYTNRDGKIWNLTKSGATEFFVSGNAPYWKYNNKYYITWYHVSGSTTLYTFANVVTQSGVTDFFISSGNGEPYWKYSGAYYTSEHKSMSSDWEPKKITQDGVKNFFVHNNKPYWTYSGSYYSAYLLLNTMQYVIEKVTSLPSQDPKYYPVDYGIFTATRTATASGSGVVKGNDGNKFISTFNTLIQPQNGGIISGISYTVTDDNSEVSTWLSDNNLYASTTSQIINTATRTITTSGSIIINTNDINKDIGGFIADPQPMQGGTISNISYTVASFNPKVNVVFSDTGTTTTSNSAAHLIAIIDQPPTVTSTDPVGNAVNVARNKVIAVTFSESIKAGTMWIELYNTVGTKTLIPITTSISGNVLTINHAALLTPGTKYTMALHTGSVTDLVGNSLAGFSRYFTTIDDTAPTVKSIDPVNNAVNVARNKVITVTFSESIKVGNLWIELFNGSSKVPLTTSVSGSVLTISHAALLASGTKYTLALHTGSVTDLVGNSLVGVSRYFTTSTDAVVPTLKSIDPVNNAGNVARNKVISVTFSESIKAGNLWIELYNTVGTKALIPITTSISGNVLTINHAALLAPGTKYTLALHTGSVTDLAGNSLAGVSRYFTTIDDTAPTVKSIDPVNNAVNVARNKVISVTFSEPIKAGNLWIELYSSSGVQVPITKSISGSVLTISHAALLASGTKYTLALHTGSVTDLVGNSLAGVARLFTTGTT